MGILNIQELAVELLSKGYHGCNPNVEIAAIAL